MRMADTIVAVSATPSDHTALTYTGGEPHAPTADWRLVEAAVGVARAQGARVHVGPIVSSDVFYDPDHDRPRRWRERGHLGIEMEAAVLYTIAALRQVAALTVLTVSDLVTEHATTRISDSDLKLGVDRMMELAARVAVADL
jgi:5'-methylthioadenosine phosphorylase/purine-nucleoside phosphorylase